MTRHLLKLVWNRKRANVLIAVEILLSFMVLTAVMTLLAFYVSNYRKPLGFDIQNIWTVTLEMNEEGRTSVTVESDGTGSDSTGPEPTETAARAQRRATVGRLLAAIRDMPEVEGAAAAAIVPYSGSSWSSDIEVGGRRYRYGASSGDDAFARVMGLRVTRGRWFTKEDDGAAWRPVVINERLAREMFPDGNPVGQFVSEQGPNEQANANRMRVVGVITDFRKDGEYAAPENFVFSRVRLDDGADRAEPTRELVIRVRPGTTADFEARAVARLRAVAPEWTFQAEPLPQSRETALRFWLAPVAAAAVVSLFLLIMVAMGLTGVLWLHVTQRTREIGLRRAKGATVINIRRQLVGEVLVLTTIAVIVGVGIAAQFPILDIFGPVSPGVYATGISISLALIYGLTAACAWAPGRLASAVDPAEALRYE